MTRRDFELIAQTINFASHNIGLLQSDRESLANEFADALRATNPQFDRARFLKACGVAS